MNIFVLDTDPKLAAQYHCNRHNIKMILESCQILSTTHHIFGTNSNILYKKTHVNHPCTIWARHSNENYKWLHHLTVELCKEYTHRYGKIHKCEYSGLVDFLKSPPTNIPKGPMTPFAQAMPDQYKDKNAVTAYRNYYIGEKSGMLQYKNRTHPEWIPYEHLQLLEEDYVD